MYTILLVEDERWVRTAIRKTIEKTNLPFKTVHECENGLEAIDWLKENSVDLIMTDVKMPVMGGISFVQETRNKNANLDIIFVSGYDDFPYVQSALRNGAIDYLLKPVDLEDMTLCLEKWLSKRPRIEEKPKTKLMPSDMSTIEKVIQYIEESMPGEVTLYEAAENVHLNPSYLSQMFKQKMNMNFSDYVQTQRMNEAIKLLCHTSLPIAEIGHRLGYTDTAHFSNKFKKVTSQSPSAYRKSYLLSESQK
ncbi:response regulator [Alkalihalobacillus sp. MEB130]|uniref:response regulator transcription factor n=1 Tax=Alkalihalobacillus sp. MEB130 TaxID=2976704 RepID=UPI0028DF3E44|nr:response regulator [Alkalihalobacillus sp. MEB130]MDT8858931.1 response regulator [Alkalihalobacillus sp. MEB130]